VFKHLATLKMSAKSFLFSVSACVMPTHCHYSTSQSNAIISQSAAEKDKRGNKEEKEKRGQWNSAATTLREKGA
jgi:hypothetical protein